MSDVTDTIFALGTAPGRAGIAVLRLSGPGARAALESLMRGPVPAPRRAALWVSILRYSAGEASTPARAQTRYDKSVAGLVVNTG